MIPNTYLSKLFFFFLLLIVFSCESEENQHLNKKQNSFFNFEALISSKEQKLLNIAERIIPDSIVRKWETFYGRANYSRGEFLNSNKGFVYLVPVGFEKHRYRSLLVIGGYEGKIYVRMFTDEAISSNEKHLFFIRYARMQKDLGNPSFANYHFEETSETRAWVSVPAVRCVSMYAGAGDYLVFKGFSCKNIVITEWVDTNEKMARDPEMPERSSNRDLWFEGGGDWRLEGSGGGDYLPNTTSSPEVSDLPKKKPKQVIKDCSSILAVEKQHLKNSYSVFSNYKGYTFGNGKKLPAFKDYLNKIKNAPSTEHSFGINIDETNNSYYSSSIQTGTNTNVEITIASNSVAHIHNHPENLPPSPQDIKTALEASKSSKHYEAFYTRMPDGTTYAFKVTDRNKVKSFLQKYGNTMTVDSNNRFTKDSKFEIAWKGAENKFNKLGITTAWEYTIAYLFDKYDMGLTLLKKDANSNNFKAQYVRKGSDGRYELVECK